MSFRGGAYVLALTILAATLCKLSDDAARTNDSLAKSPAPVCCTETSLAHR